MPAYSGRSIPDSLSVISITTQVMIRLPSRFESMGGIPPFCGTTGTSSNSSSRRLQGTFFAGLLLFVLRLRDYVTDGLIPQGKAVETCTILTTTPNTLLSDIHDRMPVILNPAHYGFWLTSGSTEAVLKLLRPYPRPIRRFPVSSRVNHVQNDDGDCAMPVKLQAPPQGQLFG
jgi:hypothetical protein